MTTFVSTLFTAVFCLGVYWFYYGPSIIISVSMQVVTDTRDGQLHSLNFLKEDVDTEFVQDKASILSRLYFKFKYPHGRYIIMEEVLTHILNQYFLSTVFAGEDIVIFVEPTNGNNIESITPIMWKSVGMQGSQFIPVGQRDEAGDPLHWRLYTTLDTDDPDKGEAEEEL
jgi:hypothetical protein